MGCGLQGLLEVGGRLGARLGGAAGANVCVSSRFVMDSGRLPTFSNPRSDHRRRIRNSAAGRVEQEGGGCGPGGGAETMQLRPRDRRRNL